MITSLTHSQVEGFGQPSIPSPDIYTLGRFVSSYRTSFFLPRDFIVTGPRSSYTPHVALQANSGQVRRSKAKSEQTRGFSVTDLIPLFGSPREFMFIEAEFVTTYQYSETYIN